MGRNSKPWPHHLITTVQTLARNDITSASGDIIIRDMEVGGRGDAPLFISVILPTKGVLQLCNSQTIQSRVVFSSPRLQVLTYTLKAMTGMSMFSSMPWFFAEERYPSKLVTFGSTAIFYSLYHGTSFFPCRNIDTDHGCCLVFSHFLLLNSRRVLLLQPCPHPVWQILLKLILSSFP